MKHIDFKKMVEDWELDLLDGNNIIVADELIKYLDKQLYSQYQCNTGFFQRLAEWIGNIEDSEQRKILFKFIPYIFFVGDKEFRSLYISAFQEIYCPWVLSFAHNFKLTKISDYSDFLQSEIVTTAFTQLTDSMMVNTFLHANELVNRGTNTIWYSQVRSSADKGLSVLEGLKNKNIDKIVILDDHVGSGSQLKYVIENLPKEIEKFKVIVIPLLCGLKGSQVGLEECRKRGFEFKPVLVMNEHVQIFQDSKTQANGILEKFRPIAEEHFHKYQDISSKEYDTPFGFKKSGSLLVMHTNCPNNSMVMLWEANEEWNPLFPRSGGHR